LNQKIKGDLVFLMSGSNSCTVMGALIQCSFDWDNLTTSPSVFVAEMWFQ